MPVLRETTIRLYRAYQCPTGYFGVARIAGEKFYTCERLPNDNKLMSCIPTGEYSLVPFQGRKFKNVFHIIDVPKRKWILTHWGNTIVDTRGCILFGLGLWGKNGNLMITHSRKACKALWASQPTKIVIR